MASEKSKSVMAVIRAARPTFRNKHDKIAFSVHATFLASGYVLTATGPPAFAPDALSSSSTEEVGIDHWNEVDDEYAFVYVNPEVDSKKVLVKCLVIYDKLVVDALKDGAPEPVHVEIDVDDFIGEIESSNYSAQFRDLDKLVKTLDKEILSKVCGSPRPTTSTNTSRSENTERSSRVGESGVGLAEPWEPQIHPSGVVLPPVFPVGIGDTVPGPGAGMYPTRGGYGSGDSMLLGPNDPRWFMVDDGHPCFPGGQPGVPPGARFDPYGPPGIPGFEPSRFARNPRRPGGGTHPDLEHFHDGSDFI